MTEEPLSEPWICLAFLKMASYELWVRGKVEGTSLTFHADSKKEGRIVVKGSSRPRMIMQYSPHVMIAHVGDTSMAVPS